MSAKDKVPTQYEIPISYYAQLIDEIAAFKYQLSLFFHANDDIFNQPVNKLFTYVIKDLQKTIEEQYKK